MVKIFYGTHFLFKVHLKSHAQISLIFFISSRKKVKDQQFRSKKNVFIQIKTAKMAKDAAVILIVSFEQVWVPALKCLLLIGACLCLMRHLLPR